MIFVLPIPILLNQLYKPIISNGKPSLIKNKKAKDYEAIIKALALKQKIKCLEDVPISLKIDLLELHNSDFTLSQVITAIFTVSSIARNYLIRRWFNRKINVAEVI